MNDVSTAAPADRNELSRSLRPRHVAMITIGGIIGAGLFVGSSVAIKGAGPACIISYILTGFLLLLVMRMLGEMAVEMPQVRSFTEFTRATLGNWAGFSVGWLYWYFWVTVIPVEAIAGAGIIKDWIPLPEWVIGTALMACMTSVNLMSARAYGEFEFWFSSIKVAAIISFIILVGAHAFGFRSPTGSTFSNLVAYGGFAPLGWFAVLASVTTVIWSMMGAEVVTIAAAESPEPARAVARMTSTIITRILLFYVLSVFVITCVVPWNKVVPAQSPFTLALDEVRFPFASTIHGGGGPHCGALLPQFLLLYRLAGAVRARDPRRCATLAGAHQCATRAGARRAARERLRLRRRNCGDSLPHRGVRVPDELLRRHHRDHLPHDRLGAGALAPRPGTRRTAAVGAADVDVPVVELPRHCRDGLGAGGDGVHALASRRALDQHGIDCDCAARVRDLRRPKRSLSGSPGAP